MKKSHKSVSYEKSQDGYVLFRDDNPIQTPMGKVIALPSRKLAEAMAKESDSGSCHAALVAASGPARPRNKYEVTQSLMHLVCMAIDLFSDNEKRETNSEELLAYADTDLICYRAGTIPALAARQAELLNPIVAWANHRFAITLEVTDGLIPVPQQPANKIRLKAELAAYDNWKLAALAAATKPLGSLFLALALCENHISGQQAFNLAHLEEAYETQQWGEDEEKKAKMAKIREEILHVKKFLSLLQ
jgi:chaperone required for assembly of F1-ATPase